MTNTSSDLDHLKILSIMFYVYAGMTALFASIPIIHVIIGVFFLVSPPPTNGDGPPAELFGGIFLGVGLLIMTFGFAKAITMFLVGRKLRKLEHRTFCFIGAAIACTFIPFGTILGVFTILTLSKDSVRALFEAREPLDSL